MKKYLLALCLFISTNSFAQSKQAFEIFAQAYFEHFKAQDFDWILKQYSHEDDAITFVDKIFEEREGHKMSENDKLEFKEDLIQAKVDYAASLNSFSNIPLIKTAKFERLEISDISAIENLKLYQIIFSKNDTEFYIEPDLLYINEKGKVKILGERVRLAEYTSKSKMVPPPPPPPPMPRTKNESRVVVPLDDGYDLASPVIPDKPKMVVEKYNNENAVYEFVEQEAEFPGAEEAMLSYLASNMKYPRIAKENQITGIVYLTFIVEKDGSLTGIEVARDIGGGCGLEARRLINEMPKWKPAVNNGKVVRSAYTLPILFDLKK